MATLFVDKIDPQSGTALEIGSSGDTITIPSGATITNNGTQTGFGGANTPNFFAYVSSNYSVNSTTETTLPLNAELYDTASAFNTSTYTFTVPSGQAGKYYLFGQIRKNNFSGSRTFFEILRTPSGGSLGGIYIAENSGGSDGYISISGSTVISLSVGDALQMQIYHNDSGSREFFGGFQNSFFGGYKIIE